MRSGFVAAVLYKLLGMLTAAKMLLSSPLLGESSMVRCMLEQDVSYEAHVLMWFHVTAPVSGVPWPPASRSPATGSCMPNLSDKVQH